MFFEPRVGVDLSRVRIFSDSCTAGETAAINARAFTTGDSIVFSPGAYAPETGTGRALLAHELAHIVQQRTSQSPSNRIYRSPQENFEVMQAEEMNYLAVKNAWPVAIGSTGSSKHWETARLPWRRIRPPFIF